MNEKSHDIKMRDVYAHIYTDFYKLETSTLSHAQEIIGKNLKEMSISHEEIKRMNVFNIGPSREAIALHSLGARAVYHFDISEIAVGSILKLKEQNSCFGNIYSRQTDICLKQDLSIGEKIDMVYLAGVLHHLYDPKTAIQNIFRPLSVKPKLFFRIYRSGSLAFFIVDFIRKFIGWSDKDMVINIFQEKFKDKGQAADFLYKDMYDDFFVPVLKLYDPEKVNAFFHKYGLEPITGQKFPKYDHADTSASGQGWSLCYGGRDFKYNGSINTEFPGHVDQMTGINYQESHIRSTIKLMEQFLKLCNILPMQLKVNTALDLYEISQLYRMKNKVSSEDRHAKIQQIITNTLSV